MYATPPHGGGGVGSQVGPDHDVQFDAVVQRVVQRETEVDADHADWRAPADAEAGADLTLAQLSILLTLLDRGPIRMTELAAHERVRTPTTTVAIRRLEKLGLVKRSRDPSDLRAVLVNVTPRGLVQHREALEARRQVLIAMMAKLTPEDIDNLSKALAQLEKLATSNDD